MFSAEPLKPAASGADNPLGARTYIHTIFIHNKGRKNNDTVNKQRKKQLNQT